MRPLTMAPLLAAFMLLAQAAAAAKPNFIVILTGENAAMLQTLKQMDGRVVAAETHCQFKWPNCRKVQPLRMTLCTRAAGRQCAALTLYTHSVQSRDVRHLSQWSLPQSIARIEATRSHFLR